MWLSAFKPRSTSGNSLQHAALSTLMIQLSTQSLRRDSRFADLCVGTDPPCGVTPLVWPAAGPGPASNIPVPRPQARPGTRPTQHTPPQKPLFRRFCPRVSSPIFAPKKPPPRFLFRPASVFSHTLLYTFGPAPASQAAARSVPCSGHLASTENFDRGWGHPGRPGVTR